ncbi:hypothetical protein KUCAC02_035997, partial [Chaenocephalus aceratus]
ALSDGGAASGQQNVSAGFLQLRLHHQPHRQTRDTTHICAEPVVHLAPVGGVLEFPSRSLPVGSRNLISPKLTELKTGIQLLMKANQDAAEMFADGSPLPLAPTGNYYQSSSMRRTYELLSCFKKDMHKVETYLSV